MKTRKILSFIMLSLITALAFNCTDDDGVTTSLTDVSSRITGFSSEISGAGASLSVTGTNMDKVTRLFVGNYVVAARNFTNVTPTGFTFIVPTSVGLGMNKILFVWPGSERGLDSINIVPLQVVSAFHPYAGAQGEVITVLGQSLDIVNAVKIGDASATILSNTGSVLTFEVPAGIATGKVTLSGPAGAVTTATDLTACDADPTNVDCADALTLNSGFELGTGDNFDNWSKYNGGAYMVQTTSPAEVFKGSRALKVIRDGSLADGQWRIQLASDLIDTEIGASYTVYIWAKAVAAGGGIRVSTSPSALYTGDQAITTSWTRLAFTFTANVASTRVVLDLNGTNTAVTTFFLDEVKLLKN